MVRLWDERNAAGARAELCPGSGEPSHQRDRQSDVHNLDAARDVCFDPPFPQNVPKLGPCRWGTGQVMSEPLIKIRQVSKAFGRFLAVHSIDLDIEEGAF